MTATPEFCSVHGRIYTAGEVRPKVLAFLRRKWRGLKLIDDWVAVVDATCLRNQAWLRRRNGETPASLAREVERDALHLVLRTPPTRQP